MLMSAGLPVSANAINKDVGVHTKVSLNVRHRVVSPARIAERTACAFYLFIRQPMGRKSALRREIPWILRGFQGRLSC